MMGVVMFLIFDLMLWRNVLFVIVLGDKRFRKKSFYLLIDFSMNLKVL